jgi:hypothetical protein
VDQANQFELRPMGVGDILDTALRLYRARFVPFLTISLVVYVPYIALLLALGLAVGGEPEVVQTPFGEQASLSPGATILVGLGNILFFFLLWPLVQGAMIYNISAAYLGEQIGAGESYRRAASRLVSLLGTQILVGLVVCIGLVLLIVPGVIFGLWYMVILPVVLFESLGGSRAMSRSHALMGGNLGKGFLVSLVVGALSLAVGVAASMALHFLGVTHPVVDQALTQLLNAVLLPFLVAPTTLLYYDLRIRKEAFDLQHLSESMTGVPRPA